MTATVGAPATGGALTASAPGRGLSSRIGSGVVFVLRALAIIYLLAPLVAVVVLSFSNDEIMSFPPKAWGMRQYNTFLGSEYWLDAVWQSFQIAVPSALISLAIGLPVTVALYRTRLPLKGLFQAIGLSPLVLPGVAYAVALYTFFVESRIIGSTFGLIVVHAVLGLPFMFLIIGAGLARIPSELELVAMTLGASRWRAMLGVTLRLLLPAIGASTLFAFITSFDEAVVVNFLGGPSIVTLPKAIYDSVKTGIDPSITAIATLLMAGTGLIMALAVFWRGKT